MAKEISLGKFALGKRARISEAQKYMLLAVLGASIFLGVAIAMVMHFVKQISFNARIIAAEEQSIDAYSSVIQSIGVCEKPRSGKIYSNDELKKCDPNDIELSKIPNTLRSNILENLAASDALNSVPKEDDSSCINPKTNKNYTYSQLNELYNDASTESEIKAASQLIKTCSALRVIPDALPASKNEEALLASLNKLFIVSNWEPEALSPSGSSSKASFGSNLNTISVRLSVEADTGTTMNVLSNIERSIREFNVERATIEWGSNNSLILNAQATAYFVDKSTITETTKKVTVEEKK